MSIVGFDIGNDTSVVAVVKTQAVHVLLNNDSKYETPSVVSFAQKKRQIGSQAASLALRYPEATISQIKRIIGKRYDWPGVADELSQLPFLTSEGPNGSILIHVNYAGQDRAFTPVQILAMLFSNLRKMVETNSGSISTSTFYAIGVPSYFTDSERIAYLDAAEIAGMDRSRLQLVHEGTATALGYGFYKNDMRNGSTIVVFVDIGHCATQVTVVEFKVGRLRVLSHASDRNVGGRDFDRVLFDNFRKKFHEEHKIDINAPKNWRACARLMAACEKAKKDLTSNSEARISIDCLVNDLDASGFITRKDFEEMSRDLRIRIVRTCEKALTLEGIDVRSVNSVELTGSGSRIPAVSELVDKYFRKKHSRTLNGSECVARGCALQCVLTNRLTSTHYKVEDCIPFTVGYISQPSDVLLFLRGQQFPCALEYKYKYDLKDGFNLDIFQIDQSEWTSTRCFKVGPFQVQRNQYSPVAQVKFGLTNDGIIEVCASLTPRNSWNNALEWQQVIKIASYGMEKEALLKATYEENVLALMDRKIDEIQEKRNTLEAFVYDTQKKFNDRYCNFSSNFEKGTILESLQETEKWLYEDSDEKSRDVYSDKLRELTEFLHPIKNRCMIYDDNTQAARVFQCHINNIRKEVNSYPNDIIYEIHILCDEADQWLWALQKFLDLTPKNTEQVLLLGVITERMNTFIQSCQCVERGEKLDCSRRKARSLYPCKAEEIRHWRTPLSFGQMLLKKLTDLGSFARRSFTGNPKTDGISSESIPTEPFDLICNNEFQNNHLSHETKQYQDPGTNMQMTNRNPAAYSAELIYSVNNSDVLATQPTLIQEQVIQDVKRHNFKLKELEAYITKFHTKFLQQYGSFATDLEKNEISMQMHQVMHELNNENGNNIQIDYSGKVGALQAIVESTRERYLDKEANAAAVQDLLYCIFQYRVQTISSKDFVKQEVQKKCSETEEWLEDRRMLQDKAPKTSNAVLRFRDILEKMGELETLYQTTLQIEAAQDHPAKMQNSQSMLSSNNVLEADVEKKNVLVEDATNPPAEMEVVTTEASKEADAAYRPVKEEFNQRDTPSLQTSLLAEAEISKNDDEFRDTNSTVDPPRVPNQPTEVSKDETGEGLSSPSHMDVDCMERNC